jgi:hypothetical protein
VQLRCWRSPVNDGHEPGKSFADIIAAEYGDFTGKPAPVTDAERAKCSSSHYVDIATRLGEMPEHLVDAFAYAQVIDIGRELVARTELSLREAVIGIAGEISRAVHRDGADVLNLSMIAYRLIGKIERGNLTWAYDLPSKLDPRWVNAARKNAERLAQFAASCGQRVNVARLSATLEFEELHERLLRFGNGDITIGGQIMSVAIQNTPYPDEGEVWVRWAAFDKCAEAEYQRLQK